MDEFLQTLTLIIFESNTLFGIILECVAMIGEALIFRKCGGKWWYCLIPCYRVYLLAKCCNRESEGKALFSIRTMLTLLAIGTQFIPLGYAMGDLQTVFILGMNMAYLIYCFRLGIGMCELFQIRHGWKFVWVPIWGILPEAASLIWGVLPLFKPAWQYNAQDSEVDNFFSGSQAEVLSEGLTVNLEERVAKELFQKKTLLQDVHMEIRPGHMVLLLGGSGAGKTTLLNAINGYEPAKAEIHLNGSNIYKEYKRMQYEIGFVPQQDLMRENDTVLHTLYDAAALRLPQEFSTADRHTRVKEIMEIFGLTPVKSNLVGKLSGGQRKRLSIAIEFISNPSLFILDEPDSGLDGVMARELMHQLRMIADHGKIVIVITHTPDRVIDLFDDVIVLAKDKNRTGRLAYYGPVEEAKTFFGQDSMEHIVRSINRKEEGGEGRADEFVQKFAEVQQNATASH